MKRIRIPAQAIWFAFAVVAGGPTAAQSLTGAPAPSPSPGLYATAPVVLDGQTLFTVAVPGTAGETAAAGRVSDIDDGIAEVLATGNGGRQIYDANTLDVEVTHADSSDVLGVTDARHRTPLPIVTVTSSDAASSGLSQSALAAQWQTSLKAGLVHALVIREPRAEQTHLIQVAAVAAVLLLASFLAIVAVRRISRRIGEVSAEVERHQQSLATAQEASAAKDDAAAEHGMRRARAITLRALKPAQQLLVLRAIRDLLVWGGLLSWCVAIGWGAAQFPETALLGHTFAHNAFTIVVIFLATGFVDRILTVLIGRLPAVWELRAYGSTEQRERQTLRLPTIVRALNGFKTFVLLFFAVLSALTQIGIPVGSVVTIGGVAAIAVSLAAQNLIRDVVSGFLVLAEDQFVLGDFVTINGASGIVERLTLRMVQLRDGTGGVITISHSSATSVINHSRNWSRVDYAVAIDPAADADRALALVRDAIHAVASSSPDATANEREPIEWIGIDGLSRDGIVVRARIRTGPLRQYSFQRELNLEVSRAFGQAKIAYGAPVATITPSS